MSSAENEAVEAGARAAYESDEVFLPWESAPDDYAATYRRDAKTHYDAMREIIARDVIAGICKREGHLRVDMTPLDSLELVIRCGRCGGTWNEPRPEPALPEPWRPGISMADAVRMAEEGATLLAKAAWRIPAPEPCPFDGCGQGPLGRDALIDHIAQQHPDARSAQSVLGEDDPREDRP